MKEGSTRRYLACIGAYHPLGIYSLLYNDPLPSLTHKVLSIDLFSLSLIVLFSLNQLEFRMSANILNSVN